MDCPTLHLTLHGADPAPQKPVALTYWVISLHLRHQAYRTNRRTPSINHKFKEIRLTPRNAEEFETRQSIAASLVKLVRLLTSSPDLTASLVKLTVRKSNNFPSLYKNVQKWDIKGTYERYFF